MNHESKALSGISCDVDSCVYNDGHQCCTAQSIKVKNRMNIHGEETMCETFEKL